MIVVRLELHSAITGEITELGTAIIDNQRGTTTIADYRARFYKKGDYRRLVKSGDRVAWNLSNEGFPTRTTEVTGHRRLQLPVWTLVRKALQKAKF